MGVLTGSTIASTYKDLTVISGSGSGITDSLVPVTDGTGTGLPYKISTLKFQLNNTSLSILGTDGVYPLYVIPGSALTAARTLTVTTGDADRTLTMDGNITASTIVTASSTNTLTNKSISLTTNTVSGTLAEFNNALSGNDFVSLTGTESLSNKTFIAPALGTPLSGVLTNCTFPTLNQDTSGTAAIATTVTTTATSTNSAFYLPFVSAATTGNRAYGVDTDLSYNPSTNTLTTTTFSGALSGNASTATTATTATVATTVTTTATSTNATYYPTFVSAATTGDRAHGVDVDLSYNPSTNALTATTFVGALTGNASGSSGSCTGNAATVTTNANLTGPVTSVGNATTIASGVVTEAMQVLADNTTNNVSTTKHGYAPKSPNDATKFLDGTGAYSTPSGSGVANAFTQIVYQAFTGSGTYTPNANMKYCIIEIVGGGGGSGGSSASATGASAGEGGSGGGFSRGVYTRTTILGGGSAATVTIGAAGSAAAAGNNNGGTGGTSTVIANSGAGSTLIQATGGAGGQGDTTHASNNSNVTNPAPGTGSLGTLNIRGGYGQAGQSMTTAAIGGAGGNSGNVFGQGGPQNNNGAGTVGLGFGAGAGAAASITNTDRAGAAGTAGYVLVTEFLSV